MKKHLVRVPVLSALAGGLLLFSHVAPAHAQNLETRVSSIEFKDASLRWALEMLFKADNTPSYSIDPAAEDVSIGALTLQNITVRNAISQLLNQNNFKLSRGVNGIYVVEPREPVGGEFGEGDLTDDGRGDSRGGRDLRGGRGGSTPGNPFGSIAPTRGGGRMQANRQLLPPVQTQSNPQTTPRFGGGGGTTTTDSTTTDNPPTRIEIKHIYAGGIALLFGGSVLPTLPFVAPASAVNGGGQGGQGGGFGGNQGGFGGNQGGFGGGQGGFGGGQGGFGGGIGGNTGFGGGGGFGGNTGFGGGQGGFGGGQGGFGGGIGGNTGFGGGGGFGF